MNVQELIAKLQQLPPELDVCVDVDDGIKGAYELVIDVRLAKGATGDEFVAIDSSLHEQTQHWQRR